MLTQSIYVHVFPFSIIFPHWDEAAAEIFPQGRQWPWPILYNQYHGCWWPGDARSQGISCHCIDLVHPKYFRLSTRRVNWLTHCGSVMLIHADSSSIRSLRIYMRTLSKDDLKILVITRFKIACLTSHPALPGSNELITQVTILQWHHNERDGISNHQPHDCLLNRLFKAQIKENIKAPRHWPLWGKFTGDKGPVTRKCFHLMTSSWKYWVTHRWFLLPSEAICIFNGLNQITLCIMNFLLN